MKPFFSIITATYNAEAVLPVLLDSLAGQTCRDYELVVQDNLSSDGTMSLLRDCRQALPALSLCSEADSGIYDAWNKAVDRARGQWLLFLGADDCLHGAESLAQARQLLEKLPEKIIYLGCAMLIASREGIAVQTVRPARNLDKALPQSMALPHPALFYRRDIFKHNCFSTKLKIAGDYEFLCRTLGNDNYRTSELVVSCMRVGGVSASPLSMLQSERELLEISRRCFPGAWRPHLYARMGRSLAVKALAALAGPRAGYALADRFRQLSGKAPLWSRAAAANCPLPALGPQPLVSLLIATLGRPESLRRLLASLEQQSYRRFEILIADQNPPGYLEAASRWAGQDIEVKRINISPQGASRARNILLELARGDIIAFPDDDCLYLPDTLRFIVRAFGAHPHLAAILAAWSDRPGSITDETDLRPVARKDSFYGAGTLVQFYRCQAMAGMYFDTGLGPGAGHDFTSGEDTDFLLRVMEAGGLVGKSKSVLVLHPKPAYADQYFTAKTKGYALGRMRLLHKHKFSFVFKLLNILYPLVKMVFEGRRAWRYRATMFVWRLRGYLVNKK
jgi:glycosyltransferase involved in cell wall biosynthesis